jgi:hypothetical protein
MGRDGTRDPADSLRGLTAPGSSKVGVDKAMRARDVSRPDAVPSDPAASPADDEDAADSDSAQSEGASGKTGSSPASS